ncbi:MAG: hypothetical protein SV765_07165 [Pseudomonadota bacterium]|nr:hypothetical protein [Pseudomonadota bacterium]
MRYSRTASRQDPRQPLEPKLFGAAFLQLDQVIERFHPMLEDDQFLQENLDVICDQLKSNAIQHEPVAVEECEQIVEHLDRVTNHAQDMAKEEQRIIEESHLQADGEEEQESAAYFELANQLRLCSAQFRRNLLRAA